MTSTQFAVGRYLPSEGSLVHRGKFAVDGQDKLVLVCHGRTPLAQYGCLQWAQMADFWPMLLADSGYTVLAIDSGGDLTWGNGISIRAGVNAIAWARGAGVCHPTKKVAIVGYSMGGLEAFNLAAGKAPDSGSALDPAQVAGLALFAPATDIDYFYPDATYGPEIDTAYATGYAGYSPIGYAPSVQAPVRMYHAVDDATIPLAQSQAMLAALGSKDKTLVQIDQGGHAAFWGRFDQLALLRWLNGLAW